MPTKIVPEDAVLIPAEAKRVFTGVMFDVYQWPQQLFDGSTTTFEMVRRSDTIIVIGMVGNKVVVTRDEQPHSGVRHGFPAGRAERGEDPLTAAQREMREETGYTFRNWRLVCVAQTHHHVEWFMYVYLAWDEVALAETHQDAGEKITVELLPFADARQLILDAGRQFRTTIDLLEPCHSLADLLDLPESTGKTVDVQPTID